MSQQAQLAERPQPVVNQQPVRSQPSVTEADFATAPADGELLADNLPAPGGSPGGANPIASSNNIGPANNNTPAQPPLTGSFFGRMIQAYKSDWSTPASDSGPVPHRGYEAPESDPPFPFTMWPYGGSVTIGQPFQQSAPLMQAIWSGSNGDWWKKSGIQIYGWLNGGFNVSTSTGGGYSNFPAAYSERGNSISLDQEVIYIDKQPDTVQTDHIDWGFRISPIYGLDYRYTTSKGFLSSQLLGSAQGHENGFDVPMMYFDLYIPQVAQGMNIRVGRYISLPDIEAQLAPNNYTYTHSITYTFDCYTQTGVNVTTQLSKHWLLQVGLSAGCDAMPWTSDARPTLNGCLGYYFHGGGDEIYGCDNTLNNGKYAYNNLTAFYLTWYHKLNAKWHIDTESWYQFEKDTPNVNNPGGAAPARNRRERGGLQHGCRADVLRAGMGRSELCGRPD